MNYQNTSISEAYKRAQKRSVTWIVLFFIALISSCLLSLAILGLTLWGAFSIVSFSFRLWPIIAAVGLAFAGFLIVYFNWRFIFGIFNRTESYGTEIFESEQPQLFALIRETTQEVGTQFPKKVFLIKETNASVFYDSPLKSLFLPTQKNLNIGIGLLNQVTDQEFKGILAHEFGHFSQKSMAIGNYVHSIQKIIYQMMQEKDKTTTIVEDISTVNGLLALIGQGAILYTVMIEKIFYAIHQQLTIQEMALSREMEYNADQIATKVVGSENMIQPLIRIHWIDSIENQIAGVFITQKEERKFVKNYYTIVNDFVLKTAEQQQIQTSDFITYPTFEDVFHQHQSIEIEDIYSSHPELKLRIVNIEQVGQPSTNISTRKAIELLENRQAIEENFTIDYFIQWDITRRFEIDQEECWNLAQTEVQNQNYDPAFHQLFSYFDLDYTQILNPIATITKEGTEIFNLENQELFTRIHFYRIDLDNLNFLEHQKKIKTYKFDGVEKKLTDIDDVRTVLKERMQNQLEEFDRVVLDIHQFLAANSNETTKKIWKEANKIHQAFEEARLLYENVDRDTQFMFKKTHEQEIYEGLKVIYAYNDSMKKTIQNLLDNEKLQAYFLEEQKDFLNDYIELPQIFHSKDTGYDQQNLSNFFRVIQLPIQAYGYLRFEAEKEALNHYKQLLEPKLIHA